MKILPKFLVQCSFLVLIPAGANAAGTYYTGNYQSPQSRYTQKSYASTRSTNYSSQGVSSYNQQQYANAGYTTNRNMRQQNSRNQQSQGQTQRASATTNTNKNGFYLEAGLSKQAAMWQFEMNESASILHYDNIDWAVFDVKGAYVFDAGSTKMQVNAGFKYGIQTGESTMVDDDITNGGYFITTWGEDEDGDGKIDTVLGDQTGHALSIGTSKDGTMMEFNAGFGLTDFFTWGRVKVTPSIGWRYLKYELETTNNYGVSIDTYNGEGGCITVDGETQCDPVLVAYDTAGNQIILTRNDNNEIELPSTGSYNFIDTNGTYYYDQPGVSHSYEVEWSGPYLALDMLYDINVNNYVNGYVELGLPGYSAIGDQPYRFDWAHPKSVEDEAGIGSAFHLGLGANWSTKITDAVSLSIGVTYDYYSVSDADAKTYLNEGYYTDLYNARLELYESEGHDEAYMLENDTIAQNIVQLEEDCPGWVCSASGEIESFYKSLGVRVGVNAKF